MTMETTQQLEDFHLWAYDNAPALYEDEDAVRDAINFSVNSLGLTTPDAAAVSDALDASSLLSHVYIADTGTALNSMMADAYFGITAANLKQYEAVLDTLVDSSRTYAFGSTKFGEAVIEYFDVQDTTTIRIEPSKVPLVAKALAEVGLGLSIFTSIAEVAASPDPDMEGIKQGVILGAGVAVATLAAPSLAILAGATVGAGLAAVAGALAGFAVDSAWGTIESIVDAGLLNEDTPEEIAEAARGALLTEFDGVWNSTGQDAQDAFDGVLNLAPGLLDGMGNLTADYDMPPVQLPGWLEGPQDLFGLAPAQSSPLVVDLDSDGVELTTFAAATTTTFFDIDGDGFAEQTAWVSADDGLLVRDLNANGTIDDVDELFGSPTIDGFALLAELDSNGDLRIDASDTDWGDLRIWQDANGDAVTQSGELLTLSSLNIVSIDLVGVTASTSTVSGNPISHTSTFKYANGSTAAIADAWFVHDNVNTQYAGSYTLDEDAIFLPTLRGFGNLPSLHVAMSSDATLLGLVEDFALEWDWDRFADPSALDADVTAILYKWAGVEGVSTTSRGPYVEDARTLEFLEKYFGQEFLQWGWSPTPAPVAAAMLQASWDELFIQLKAQLIVQAGGAALFGNTISYDLAAGEFAGTLTLSQDAIADLVAYASDTGVNTENYWIEIAHFLEHTKGIVSITVTEEGWLDTAIYNSGLTTQNWDDIVNLSTVDTTGDSIFGDSGNNGLNGTALDDWIYGNGGSDTINGGTGDDTIKSYGSPTGDSAGDMLNGDAGDDFVQGNDGDDTISGGDGNDTLQGGAGADTLTGGADGDIVSGGTGNDSYIYVSGDEVYDDDGGSDAIYLPSGVDSGDVSFLRLGSYDLLIQIDGLGSIQIENHFNLSSTVRIETLEFCDTTSIDLSAIDTPETHGTDGDDYVEGVTSGSTGDDDVIYGYAGADIIKGFAGSDWIDGGAGNDEIWLSGAVSDTNTVAASPGYDVIKASVADDILLIPQGYSSTDVQLFRRIDNQYSLEIHIDGLGQVLVDGHFYNNQLEEIQFEDSSPAIVLANTQIATHGSDGSDSISVPSIGASPHGIIFGHGGNDTIFGNGSGNDLLYGDAGDDYISAAGGNDQVHGGDGVDTVYGAGGNDTIYGDDGNDILRGEQDDDVIYGGAGNDYLYGGFGTNQLYGGDGDDHLSVDDGNNILDGGAGNDTLIGDDYNDIFYYSSGLDTITDSWGTDTLYITGGVTVSDITFSNLSTYDTKITVTASTDELTITNQRHPTSGLRIETVIFDDGFQANLSTYTSWLNGTSGSETVSGNASANVLIGYAGDDTINAGASNDNAHGGAGADTISGETGDDLLHGGEGDDVLYGGDDLDTLFGGAGADTFVFESASAFNDVDEIMDFSTAANDVLDLTDILGVVYDPLTEAITDFIQITDDGTDSTLAVDADGGADNFVAVAMICGVTGLTDEEALETSGHLLAA